MARRPGRPSAAPTFEPFADDAAVETVGALCVENGRDRIAIHGSLDLTRDRDGLARAKRLRDALDRIVAALEAGDPPEAVAEAVRPSRKMRNPFA